MSGRGRTLDIAEAEATTTRDDVAVVRAIAGGEPAMLGRLYDRYAGATLALLVRIVGSRARGEELLQEVFLQVWRRAGDYTAERGSVAAWLFTIARNRALDVVRSAEHRLVEAHSDDDADAPPATGRDAGPERPDALAAGMERGRAVRAALGGLTPAQRRAIELAYYEGLSHSEIAERLGEPLGTVKSRIAQAMARLRAALGEHADPG